MLAERAKEWTEEWLRQGREQGLKRGRAEERALLCRLASRKFGAETGERLSGLLGRLTDPERLAEVGDWVIKCGTGAQGTPGFTHWSSTMAALRRFDEDFMSKGLIQFARRLGGARPGGARSSGRGGFRFRRAVPATTSRNIA